MMSQEDDDKRLPLQLDSASPHIVCILLDYWTWYRLQIQLSSKELRQSPLDNKTLLFWTGYTCCLFKRVYNTAFNSIVTLSDRRICTGEQLRQFQFLRFVVGAHTVNLQPTADIRYHYCIEYNLNLNIFSTPTTTWWWGWWSYKEIINKTSQRLSLHRNNFFFTDLTTSPLERIRLLCWYCLLPGCMLLTHSFQS